MPTYYQKHAQINAVQFDGTWHQLRKILPANLFNDVQQFHRFKPFHDDPIMYHVKFNDQNLITEIALNVYIWPKRNQRIKHPYDYWRFMIGTNDRKTLRAQYQSLKYDFQPTILRLHDYMQIDQNIENRHLKRPYARTHLRIYRKQAFESHWSKTPIKKK